MVMARGGYSFEELKKMSLEEIYFLYHYQELSQLQQQEFFSNALGIIWNKDDFIQQVKEGTSKNRIVANKLFIPLSIAVNPNLVEYVKTQFNVSSAGKKVSQSSICGGDFKPEPNTEVLSMEGLSKEEFLKMVGQRV